MSRLTITLSEARYRAGIKTREDARALVQRARPLKEASVQRNKTIGQLIEQTSASGFHFLFHKCQGLLFPQAAMAKPRILMG